MRPQQEGPNRRRRPQADLANEVDEDFPDHANSGREALDDAITPELRTVWGTMAASIIAR